MIESAILTPKNGNDFHRHGEAQCPAEVFESARGLFDAGRIDEAEAAFNGILGKWPETAEAEYHLGHIAHCKGNDLEALERLMKATQLKPDFPEAHNHLGNALRAAGRIAEALSAFRKAASLRPEYAAPWFNMGAVSAAEGDDDEAERFFRKALELNPRFSYAYNGLGLVLKSKGKLAQAIDAFRSAVDSEPHFVEAFNNLGIALNDDGKRNEALAVFEKALSLQPHRAEIVNNRGIVLAALDRRDEAVECYRRALELNPQYPDPYVNWVAVLRDEAQLDELESCCREVLELRPNHPDALNALGSVFKEKGRLAEAGDCFVAAVSAKPNFALAWNSLGMVRQEQGKIEEAVRCYRKALDARSGYADAMNNLAGALSGLGRTEEAVETFNEAAKLDRCSSLPYSNMLLAMHYSPQYSSHDFFERSRKWERLYGRTPQVGHSNTPDCNRKLKVGYVSSDFRTHSVSYFFKPLIARHLRSEFEIICYSDVTKPDATTELLASQADLWRDVAGRSHEDVRDLVIHDKVDILVDLAGHTGKRLALFSLKPAPVQITWLGYPDTTGLSTIDYRLTDGIADPDGVDRFHSEKLVRLPQGFLCYEAPTDAPDVGPAPALAAEGVTFGSFNNLNKITPEIIRIWCSLLLRVPKSRLIMKGRHFADAGIRRRYIEMFAAGGILLHRIDLRPWEDTTAAHLAVYNEIDIALDSFPYNGTTTTCEALWMGVPVVTLSGDRHAARVGESLLSCLGMPELVAKTSGEYIDIAGNLAMDIPRLVRIRETLRSEMENSSICDAKAFTGNIEEAYRRMWREWCTHHALIRN